MPRLLYSTIATLLSSRVYGAIDALSFSTQNVTNFHCPKLTFDCPPPNACGYDKTLDKYYCCRPGDGAICSSFYTTCSNSNNQPGSNQISCSGGNNAFCCLADREQCTSRFSMPSLPIFDGSLLTRLPRSNQCLLVNLNQPVDEVH